MKYMSPRARLKSKKKSVKKRRLILLSIIILVPLLISRLSLGSFFSPLSVFSQIVNPGGLLKTDGRTNILILGLDRRSKEFSGLTDTMIVVSLNQKDIQDVVIASLPRDLWVSLGEGSFAKINAAYSEGGPSLSRDVVENVLGIPIHYYLVADFDGFKEAVDILGGIEVEVERSFDDYYYPIPGMESSECGLEDNEESVEEDQAESDTEELGDGETLVEEIDNNENDQFGYPCRFESISFEAGTQMMDGELALKYTRSRHGTNNEGNDFARSKRQHKAIFAIKDRVISTNFISEIGKIKDLYDTYKDFVNTDLGITEIERLFAQYRDIEVDNMRTIILDNESEVESGGLLFTPRDRTLYGGAYVLLPRAGDFTQIHAFVQKLLFSK